MTELAVTALRAAALGIFLGALYDVFRIIRVMTGVTRRPGVRLFDKIYAKGLCNVFSKEGGRVFKAVFTAVTDVLYFTLAGVFFVLFLYCFNYGVFRWFILLSALAGFRLYYISLGKAVLASSSRIAEFLRFAVNCACFAVYYPVKFLLTATGRSLAPLRRKLTLSLDKRRGRRYTLKCTDKLKDFVKLKDVES